MKMYSSDNNDWTPAAYGNNTRATSPVVQHYALAWGTQGNPESSLSYSWQSLHSPFMYMFPMFDGRLDHQEYGDGLVKADPSDVEDPWYIDASGTPQPYPSAPGAGMVNGIALLYVGGYLTQKGAAVLECPSKSGYPGNIENILLGVSSNFTATQARVLIQTCKDRVAFDSDEPFWTTTGRAAWSDGDGIGEMGFNGYTSGLGSVFYYRGNEGRRLSADWKGGGLAADACDLSDDWENNCSIVGSYQVRPDNTRWMTYNSYETQTIGGQAVASDAVWGFFPRSNRIRFNPGSGYEYYSLVSTDADVKTSAWIASHDASYNVLFTDGAVKTFADGGRQMYKDLYNAAIRKGNSEASSITLQDMGTLFEIYFDPLYAQD